LVYFKHTKQVGLVSYCWGFLNSLLSYKTFG
jgi:hypothetical protein